MTDDEIIEGIRSGNQIHFKALVDKYQPLVLNTSNSFLHDKTNAEDITQEVFIEVFLSIHKFKGDSKISTWLYRISANKSLNYIRDNKKRNIVKSIESFFSGESNTEFQIPDDSSQYDVDDNQSQRVELLHKAIDKLPKNQKIAFTLSKFDSLSYTQISEVLNLSLSSVEGLVHRAKKNIQKEILKFHKKK